MTKATEVAEKAHAVLGPSSAKRWSSCPGSVVLCEGRADSAGYHAKWGTAAHELAAIMLEPWSGEELTADLIQGVFDLNAESYLGRVFTVEGEDFEVDGDMATCVNDYINYLTTLIDPGDILLVEQELPIEHITGEKGATGTGDAVIIKTAAKQIVAADLKTGRGVTVYAEDNPQCTMYTDGAIYAYEPLYGPFDGWERVNAIIQPRIEHYDVEYVSEVKHLSRIGALQFAAERVDGARVAAVLCDPLSDEGWIGEYLDPGPAQCKFCDAKAICPALRGEVSGALSSTAPADRDDFPDLSLPKQAAAATPSENTDAGALSEALRAADLVEAWLKAVREEGFRRAMAGDDVPGFKLVMGKRGNRAWTDADAAEETMKTARLKVDEMYDRKLISVTTAEKLLKGRPKVWGKLAGLIGQSEGKPSLAPESDPRPRYNPVVATAEDFPELGEDEVDPFS